MTAIGTMAGFDVARARASEGEAYAKLHGRCLETAWRANDFSAYAADPAHIVLGAYEDGRPVGLIVCRSAAGEGEIITLAVAPEVRRRGVARALWHAASDGLLDMGARDIFLEVGTGNDGARCLYRALGFEEVGVRHGYYKGGSEDARVMALTISR